MRTYQEIDFLIKNGESEEALQHLNDIKAAKTLSVDETAWMYWNISDIPAVMRQPHAVYENHIEFVEWGKQALFPHKLHWFVTDITQALTLSLGEYFDEWFDWYLFACKHSSRNERNRGIRFESHRAAASALLILERLSEIEIPLRNLLELLEEDKDWENTIFAEFIYFTLLAEKAFILNQKELLNVVTRRIIDLTDKAQELISSKEDIKDSHMLGSWEGLNSSRHTKESMAVLFHNGGCTFNKISKYEESIKMFQLALQNGSNITTYGLSLYLSSLWKVNNDNSEIVETFIRYSSKGLNVNEMFQFAPDLKCIDWQALTCK